VSVSGWRSPSRRAFPLRCPLAFDGKLLGQVLCILRDTVASWYRKRHALRGLPASDLRRGALLDSGNPVGQAEAMAFQVECPFCGEPGSVEIEPTDFEPGEHVLVQDCEVCCRPWTVRVQMDPNGTITVNAERD
jgi:Cysteine-rich CPXCG